MKPVTLGCVVLVLSLIPQSSIAGAPPIPIIFDTDMDSDCDDAGALAMLHALADGGEVRILATPVSALHPWSGPCVDAINTYFGRPNLPIGIPSATPNKQGSRYAERVAREFPHDFPSEGDRPDAVQVYRRVLASQPEGSVVIVTVGDVTNVCDLLKSKGDAISPLDGIQLVQAKAKHWVCMGGRYPVQRDPAKYGNFKMDPKATVEAVKLWPRPLIFTGGGAFARQFKAGERLRELPKNNPIRRVYEEYFGGVAKDRHCADLIAVLVAARGTGTPWKEVTQGYNHVFDNGTHEWRETPDNPRQSYISELEAGVDPISVTDTMETLMLYLPSEGTPKACLYRGEGHQDR